MSFVLDHLQQTVPEIFRDVAARFADLPAIVDSDAGVALTYRELDAASNRVAHALLARTGGAAQPVAILVEHGAWPMVGMLGALKAGAFYASLEPGYPQARLLTLLEDLQPAAILTNRRNAEDVARLAARGTGAQGIPAVLVMDELAGPSDAPAVAIAEHDLAVIVYTSGSTGEPKGVAISHRSLLNWPRTYLTLHELGPQTRHALTRSTAVAGAFRDIYGSLLTGAALYPFDTARHGFPALARWLRDERITHHISVVTILRNLVRHLPPDAYFPDMRGIFVGGEILHKSDFLLCRPHFPPECLFYYGLAMTETGTLCGRALRMADEIGDEERISMTQVARHTGLEIFVLGDDGERLPPGAVGEIAIRSPYLAQGYWRKPELTRAKFLPDLDGVAGPDARRIFLCGDYGRLLPEGGLEYVGRRDFQAKVNGERIDLAEIESALLGIDGMVEAAVVVHKEEHGDDALTAYLVVRQPSPLTVSALRQRLAELLSPVMLPRRFVFADALPKTTSGKVDRRQLPAPERARPRLDQEYVPPRTELEREIAGVWQEVLDIEPIGVRDHFLDLGGNSILAARIAGRLLSGCGVEISLQTLLAAPTVEAIAVSLIAAQAQLLDRTALDAALAQTRERT